MAMPHSRMHSESGSPPLPERSIWTVDDLEQLPDDGNRYETLYGELLVTPLPSSGHQRVAVNLVMAIGAWCRAHTGWAIRAPGGVYISRTVWLEPDVVVYPAPHMTKRPWKELPTPVFVVEVAGPSTRKRDRHGKRPAYLSNGVGEVWLVDEDTRTVERWTSASEFPETMRDTFTWAPDAAHPPMIMTADELFGPSRETDDAHDDAHDDE